MFAAVVVAVAVAVAVVPPVPPREGVVPVPVPGLGSAATAPAISGAPVPVPPASPFPFPLFARDNAKPGFPSRAAITIGLSGTFDKGVLCALTLCAAFLAALARFCAFDASSFACLYSARLPRSNASLAASSALSASSFAAFSWSFNKPFSKLGKESVALGKYPRFVSRPLFFNMSSFTESLSRVAVHKRAPEF